MQTARKSQGALELLELLMAVPGAMELLGLLMVVQKALELLSLEEMLTWMVLRSGLLSTLLLRLRAFLGRVRKSGKRRLRRWGRKDPLGWS